MTAVLDVDLLAFEQGTDAQRRVVVDGVMQSLGTGFVFTSHDIPDDLLDEAYAMLARFFALTTEEKARWRVPESHGQTGYTGLLVETAATSDLADWKEMLNWGAEVPGHHPLRARYPQATVVQGDAYSLRRILDNFLYQPAAAIVSGLPYGERVPRTLRPVQ